MKNLATKNTTDFTITENGEAFISQRKAAALMDIARTTLQSFLQSRPVKSDIKQGLTPDLLQEVVQHYAYKGNKTCQEFMGKLLEAGAKAYIYHEAGYVVEAKKPEAIKPITPLSPESLHPLQVANLALDTAERWGFEGNQALLSADKATKALTGHSPLALMGHKHLTNEKQEQSFTPTELGSMLPEPISARSFNLLLERNGLQVKEDKHWIPTDLGKPFAHVLDTNKKHSDGTPIQQIKWYQSVLDNLTNP